MVFLELGTTAGQAGKQAVVRLVTLFFLSYQLFGGHIFKQLFEFNHDLMIIYHLKSDLILSVRHPNYFVQQYLTPLNSGAFQQGSKRS